MSTTPNSPIVCANASTAPAITPSSESGRMIRKKVRRSDAPSVDEASMSDASTCENAAAIGCTANGRLYSTDAITRPSNVKARPCPVQEVHSRPTGLRAPIATST